MSGAWLTIVGLGEDGLDGLSAAARRAVETAPLLIGGTRHLALIPPQDGQQRQEWPSPFSAAFDQLQALRGQPVCVLATGDPMHYGIGASLTRQFGAAEMRVFPGVSSFTLAAVRLGWALQDVGLLTIHGRPLALLNRHLADGARLLILAENGDSPAAVAAALTAQGFGASDLVVLEHMGGPQERRQEGRAADWSHPRSADLNVIALTCRTSGEKTGLAVVPGLPDTAYHHDGQLTKRAVRAVTLAHLGPRPGELLWDVGGGCGSIGIEWMRAHPACQAIAVEQNRPRQALLRHNADTLGVPGLRIVDGKAPEALAGLPAPDVIFIGGGVTVPGVPEACWAALKPGGRLVANAVTLQSEALLVALRGQYGGTLVRLSVAEAAPLGGFDGWKTAMPVSILTVNKPAVAGAKD